MRYIIIKSHMKGVKCVLTGAIILGVVQTMGAAIADTKTSSRCKHFTDQDSHREGVLIIAGEYGGAVVTHGRDIVNAEGPSNYRNQSLIKMAGGGTLDYNRLYGETTPGTVDQGKLNSGYGGMQSMYLRVISRADGKEGDKNRNFMDVETRTTEKTDTPMAEFPNGQIVIRQRGHTQHGYETRY